jgi:hypothetical protein
MDLELLWFYELSGLLVAGIIPPNCSRFLPLQIKDIQKNYFVYTQIGHVGVLYYKDILL